MTQDERNNQKCLDLTDLQGPMPLEIEYSKKILFRSEKWEYKYWDMQKDRDSLGYPSVVRNIYGRSPDNRYYLFYAHHGPNSSIGCAVADRIDGPYQKIASIYPNLKDSRVLIALGGPGDPYHYCSPCVIWNNDTQLWFMYFHYFEDEWDQGKGHQKTGLAMCKDIKTNIWTIYRDSKNKIIPVLPVTKERWMNSQSSYHAIQRLPNGQWLGFLRGTGGEYQFAFDRNRFFKRHLGLYRKWVQDTTKIGFAFSSDGINWKYLPSNPIIIQQDIKQGRCGVLRPHFVGYLGKGKYFICWSDSKYYDSDQRVIYGSTQNFIDIDRDQRGYTKWKVYDGLVSPWREDNKLYLFTGAYIYTIKLPSYKIVESASENINQ